MESVVEIREYLRIHTTVESWVMLRDTARVMRPNDVATPDRLATRGNDKKDSYSTGPTRKVLVGPWSQDKNSHGWSSPVMSHLVGMNQPRILIHTRS